MKAVVVHQNTAVQKYALAGVESIFYEWERGLSTPSL